jgi:hypothetical protein
MSTTITHDEAAQNKQHKKTSHHKFQFDFSTTEDLFISTKGRELRNKQKKLDKIVALEKQVKKGEGEINDTQKEMVASKQVLKTEVAELESLVELYVKSNPNYSRKNVEEKKVEEVIVEKKVVDEASINHGFKLLANLFLIKNVVASPHHISVVPGEEFHSIEALYKLVDQVRNVEINLSFDKSKANQAAEDFAKAFTSLSQKRAE